MIEFFMIVFIVTCIATAINIQNAKMQKKLETLVKGPTCPPHKWRHEEVKDHEGVTHAWKMVCDNCGPLQPLDVRKDEE